MSQQKQQAVVIGGGLAGMVSSLLLAMNGYQVSLIETEKKVGLTLRGFLKSRIYFDSGLHFAGELSENGLLSAYLRYLGLTGLECVDFDQQCFEKVRFSDGREFEIPIGYEAQVHYFCNEFPAEKQNIQHYMQEVRAAYYSSPFHSLRSDIEIGAERNHPQWQVSLTQFIEQSVQDPYLRTLLAIPCLYHGVSPDETSFIQHAWVTGTHFDSVRTFSHGGSSLVEAFEKRLAELDVVLYCGRNAVRVHCNEDGSLKEIEMDNGERLPCSVAIYTAHPHYLPDMLPEKALRPVARKRLQALDDGMSAHLLYLTTTEPAPPDLIDKRNAVYCQADLPFNQQFATRSAGHNGPYYVMAGPSALRRNAENADEPVDYVAVAPCTSEEYISFYGTGNQKRPSEYRVLKKQRLAELSEQLFNVFPEMSAMRVIDGGTPLTLQKYLHSPQCGMYGVAHTMTQYTPLPNTRIPGFFIAGQGVTSPGVLGVLISAFVACGFLVGHSTLIDGVRACK